MGLSDPDRRPRWEEAGEVKQRSRSSSHPSPQKTTPPLRRNLTRARGHGLRSKEGAWAGTETKGGLFLAVE